MTRGYSLEQDLRLLINNQKYSDVEIICEDEKKLHGCRAILAARSEVFDRLLYNGMKESYEKEISFPKINSIGMEMILEYIYTGSIKEESLTKDNMIEIFYAADYFQLTELQNFIMKTFKNTLKKNYTENYSPELLSKFAEKIPLTENNILLNLLVEAVSIIPLNRIEFGRLSISGLQYLLTCTHEEGTPFATPEYEVFRYSAILTAKQVSDNAYKALMKQLPTLEQIKQIENPIKVKNENKIITDHQKVVKELEPLIKFIDFRRIEGQILTDVIEPLEIISEKIILDVYRQKAKLNESDLNNIRGIPIPVCVWDDTACGSKLIFENNGKIVRLQSQTKSSRNVKAKMILEDKGIFEWDFIIEKACGDAWVGVCSPENLNYEFFAGKQPVGWVLGTKGRCYNSGNYINNYCPSFGDGARITVHLDMNKRTCAFTVNGTKYKEVTEWNNLPSKLYPVASLCYPGRFRIEPHQKYI
ncbi:unnamed protein product [Rhizophagus irregularis]|uniref:Btb/poz domain containing protein n=3 Tax=Rhizophagus irregularis TaxID=588596 RepID=A0A915Z0V9_9GLOM|nr:hypothetical protein RirG_255160 [Rhizophagus irregularis DAOM 197198w]CAB5188872.1 unnamed protein product [Rhizophagus irregularis]CAB5356896.1 unnamed protein product [Rhizophagus irregularis]